LSAAPGSRLDSCSPGRRISPANSAAAPRDSEADNGVLAHNNPNESVLGNLKGIDHLEDSPIGAALFGAAEECGIPVDEE
jgi:hypothetical protein